MSKDGSYNGNPRIKGDSVTQQFTQEEILEYKKCMNDVAYFCEKYVKVIHLDHGLVPFKLRGYQEELMDHFNDHRFGIVLACRQSGKSITSVAWLLHYVLFNPYKKIGILANKGATAREMLGRFTLMLENLPFFLQPGVKILNKGNIIFSHNSEIIAAATSSDSIRGLAMDCVVGDTEVTTIDDNGGIFIHKIDDFINKNMKRQFIEKDHYLVYETTNVVNGKIYVGFHSTNNIDDGYIGSGKLLKRAVEKYGPQNFTRRVLFDYKDQLDAENKEAEIVDEEFVKRKDTYNISLGGNVQILYGENNGFFGKTHSPEVREKLSLQKKGKPMAAIRLKIYDDVNEYEFNDFILNVPTTFEHLKCKTVEATKRNILCACGDRDQTLHFTDEKKQATCEKLFLKETSRDRKLEKITRYKNVSDKLTGVKKSDKHCKNISKGLLGKKKSLDHINKINKNPEKIRKTAEKHTGMKRSSASRERMSNAARGRIATNRGKRFYTNPRKPDERGYYVEGHQPKGWVNKLNVK